MNVVVVNVMLFLDMCLFLCQLLLLIVVYEVKKYYVIFLFFIVDQLYVIVYFFIVGEWRECDIYNFFN